MRHLEAEILNFECHHENLQKSSKILDFSHFSFFFQMAPEATIFKLQRRYTSRWKTKILIFLKIGQFLRVVIKAYIIYVHFMI